VSCTKNLNYYFETPAIFLLSPCHDSGFKTEELNGKNKILVSMSTALQSHHHQVERLAPATRVVSFTHMLCPTHPTDLTFIPLTVTTTAITWDIRTHNNNYTITIIMLQFTKKIKMLRKNRELMYHMMVMTYEII
jgi:hypothetical protein